MKIYITNLGDSLKQYFEVNADTRKETLKFNELSINSKKLEKEPQNKQRKKERTYRAVFNKIEN